MAKMQFRSKGTNYIFDGAGGMSDQLEQAILAELQAHQYPLRAMIQQVKAGGLLFGTKEQCVVIQVDRDSQIVISNTTVGTYLYVEVHMMTKEKSLLSLALPNISAYTDNIFKEQKRNAVYRAAKETMEIAFARLRLVQANSGYTSSEKEVTSEE